MIEASTQFMVGRLSTESGKCNSFNLDGIFGDDSARSMFGACHLLQCEGLSEHCISPFDPFGSTSERTRHAVDCSSHGTFN
jgi:hypothetical protein